MRTRLFALVLILWALSYPLPSFSQSTSIGAVIGGNAACDATNPGCQPFPVSASLICDGTGAILNCPQYFAPDWVDGTGLRFFGITGRTNPPLCVQSTNGGGTWVTCPSQPFGAAISLGNSGMSVASDGSLIFAATQLPNTCIIRRSTDYGVSWSTVFTDNTANEVCQYGNAGPTPNGVHCARASNYCSVAGVIQGSFNSRMYYSTNNGASWTKGVTFQLVSTDVNNSFSVSDNGQQGSWSMYGQTYNTVNRRFGYTTGADWTFTGVLPQPGAGTSLRCPGTMIYNGAQAVLCGPDNGAGDTFKYRLFTHAAGAVALAATVTPVNGLSNAQSPDFMAVGFNSSTAYMIGRDDTQTKVSIWVTRDNFSTMPRLTTITPATVIIGGCCRGDIVSYNGKIYFTSGVGGSQAFFGRIQ